MKVGILSERADDIAFYTPLVKRMLADEGIVIADEDIVTDTVGTHILKSIQEKTVYFFSKPAVDLAFYFSDYDDGTCAKAIETWKKEQENNGIIHPIIICFPSPHIEGWFCVEQDAVKKVFGIKGGDTLVCHPEPKKHIHTLIEQNDDPTKIARDFYSEIGEIISFDHLAHDKTFNNLRNELRRVINLFNLQSSQNLFDQRG